MKISTFAPEFFAQVAELVDALDSKSSVLNRRAGSIPALSTNGVSDIRDSVFIFNLFPASLLKTNLSEIPILKIFKQKFHKLEYK